MIIKGQMLTLLLEVLFSNDVKIWYIRCMETNALFLENFFGMRQRRY